MIKLDQLFEHDEVHHEVLPLDHPMMVGRVSNIPIYVQDYQWRLIIQPFSHGGFEARISLINRNAMSRMIEENRYRGKRIKPKEKDESTQRRNNEKSATRATQRVRQLCIEIRADRLLTLTSRELLTDIDQAAATWKKFLRVLKAAGKTLIYVAVPELHKNGKHYHIHVAINGHIRADLLRRCWQIALGGKGNERGVDALGNVDIKRNRRNNQDAVRHTLKIAQYISKYISKDFQDHHQFNRKHYWASRGVKLLERHAEWMQAETQVEVMQELYERFGPEIMSGAIKTGILISNANTPVVFFRHLPDENDLLPIPF